MRNGERVECESGNQESVPKEIPSDGISEGIKTKNHGVVFSMSGRRHRPDKALINLSSALWFRVQISDQQVQIRRQVLFFPGCLLPS